MQKAMTAAMVAEPQAGSQVLSSGTRMTRSAANSTMRMML